MSDGYDKALTEVKELIGRLHMAIADALQDVDHDLDRVEAEDRAMAVLEIAGLPNFPPNDWETNQ